MPRNEEHEPKVLPFHYIDIEIFVPGLLMPNKILDLSRKLNGHDFFRIFR